MFKSFFPKPGPFFISAFIWADLDPPFPDSFCILS